MNKLILAAIFISSPALAAQVQCDENPSTLQWMCITPSAVTVNGDIRSSPLSQGSKSHISMTPWRLVVNCRTKIATMQNRNGVNIAGASSGDNETLSNLTSYICAARGPRADNSLRQFAS